MATHVYIVLPAYNEEKVLAHVIQEIKSQGYKKIIVVDDGSADDTFKVAKKNHVIALRHAINRGKGAAVKTGMEAAQIFGGDVVVTMDADGQHNPKQIKLLVKKLKGGYDVVMGSRMLDYKGMPKVRVVENFLANVLTYILYNLWVSDSQSGFRAYSKKALDLIETKAARYEYDSEIVKEIVRNNLTFTEIPIDVRYTSYSKSKKYKQSWIMGLKTAIRMAFSL